MDDASNNSTLEHKNSEFVAVPEDPPSKNENDSKKTIVVQVKAAKAKDGGLV